MLIVRRPRPEFVEVGTFNSGETSLAYFGLPSIAHSLIARQEQARGVAEKKIIQQRRKKQNDRTADQTQAQHSLHSAPSAPLKPLQRRTFNPDFLPPHLARDRSAHQPVRE
jgi:hypothetical protein